MTLEMWLTAATLLAAFAGLVKSRLPPGVIVMAAVIFLLVTGVIDAAGAFAGFSNSGVFTVAFMYVLVAGIKETGGIEIIVRHVLAQPRQRWLQYLRLLAPVSGMSAFLNNTPVVATYIPAVTTWAERLGVPANRFLLPLSYAAILGGTCTLMGTSTNLVVNGLLVDRFGDSPLKLFDIAWVGLPVAVAGTLYMMVFHRWLLPSRKGAHEQFRDAREYTIEMEVEEGPLVNRTVEEAGLRHLRKVFLVEIERDGNIIAAVGPGERLKAGDRLVFAGSTRAVVELQQIKGLRPSSEGESSLEKDYPERKLVEAVVSRQCRFVGKTIRDGNFRRTYGAVVLAVCRDGQRVEGNLGNIRLQPADVLLLEARPPFLARHRYSNDFLLVTHVDGQTRPSHEKAWLAWSILAGVVLSAGFGLTSILNAAMVGTVAMLATGCCSLDAAKENLDMQVLLTIAASFGLGYAIDSSGLAQLLGAQLMNVAASDPWLLLLATYVMVAVLTELITNNAAAVLSFPIVAASADAAGLALMPFVIVVMMAASASFMTPIGYQTNLMVYGPGGYRVKDYLRFGAPLNLIVCAITVTVVPLVWPLQP